MRHKALEGSLLAAVLAGALATAPTASAASYDDTVRCDAKTVRNVKVRVRSSEAVVFTKRRRVPNNFYAYRSYACMFRSGPITFLRRSDFTLSRIDPQLAGRFVPSASSTSSTSSPALRASGCST